MDNLISLALDGERYTVVAPDTIDLAERAALAINGLGGTLDPELGYIPFGQIYFGAKPPYMSHWASADITCNPKYGQVFPMMRIMSGSTQYCDEEEKNRAVLLSCIQEGLYWDYYTPERPWRNIYGDSEKRYGKGKGEDFAVVGATGLMLRAMCSWRNLCSNSDWDETIRELVAGMRRVAVMQDDYCYYPEKGGWCEPCTYPRSGWLNTDEAQSETEGAEGSITAYHGNQIYGAAQWYGISGDPEALDLAMRLTRFCMKPKFWGGVADPDLEQIHAQGLQQSIAARLPDPVCVTGHEQGHWYSHFHARAITLRGMLEYAIVVGDERVLEFIRRAYEFTLTQGIPRIGWINCFPATGNNCEGCALGDLVALGIKLSDNGMGDYWDDVDAVVRNHLVEQQFVRRDLLEKIAVNANEDESCRTAMPKQITLDNVIGRGIGTFSASSIPNSLSPFVALCCTGNGTRGLYYAWEGIVRENGDTAQVNLLLNRASRLLDIDSYLPYEGKVVIHNKVARRISVRIPFWVNRRELRTDVSGKARPLDWTGNYLNIKDLKPADAITLTFPIRETTARYTVNSGLPQEQVYTCIFRGSTLVDISPRDQRPTFYPIYLRDSMRKDVAPTKTVNRFVAKRIIKSW